MFITHGIKMNLMQQITWPNDQNKFLYRHTHTHTPSKKNMVLTTQHAFKHCKTALLPPADSTRAATVLLKLQMELQQQFHSMLQNSLLFVLHSFVRVPFILFKITSTSCCSLFCFVFVASLSSFLDFFFIQFIIICFSCRISLFSLYAVGRSRCRTVIDFVCTHASLWYDCSCHCLCFFLFWFCFDLLYTQLETIT